MHPSPGCAGIPIIFAFFHSIATRTTITKTATQTTTTTTEKNTVAVSGLVWPSFESNLCLNQNLPLIKPRDEETKTLYFENQEIFLLVPTI